MEVDLLNGYWKWHREQIRTLDPVFCCQDSEFLPMHFHYLVQVDGEMIELKFLNSLLHRHESKPSLQLILSNI